MAAQDDNRLIEATLRGDIEAFGVLVERYQKALFTAATRITGNREDALEATQTAFLKAYDKLGRFDSAHRFFSWIFRIVVNESLDIAHHRRRFVDETAEHADRPGPDDPEAQYSSAQAGARVRRALLSLPPDHRAVIVLRHFHELSYSEMAQIIGIPEKTVKSRLWSARRELRQLLEVTGGDTVAPRAARR